MKPFSLTALATAAVLMTASLAAPGAAHAGNGFTGLYAGGTLGFALGDDDDLEFDTGATNGYTTHTSPRSGLLGIALGYNHALPNNFVIGIEGDAELRRGKDSSLYVLAGVPDPQYPVSTEVRNVVSLRPRLGYIFNDQRTMAFASAGVSSAAIRRTYGDTAGPTTYGTTDRHTGWTVGFGAEHFIRDNMSVTAEGRYTDFGTKNVSSVPIYGAGLLEQQTYDEFSLRAGVLFHF